MNKLQDEHNQVMLHLLGQIVSAVEQNIEANTRQEDPDWFKGMPILYGLF